MKKLLIALSFFAQLQVVQAQFVNIPDPQFKAYLLDRYAACFNGNGQMDTTCSAIVKEKTMEVPFLNIQSMEGISYFDQLISLECQGNNLTSLPLLPNSLENLRCDGNQLTSIGQLPEKLATLYCASNQIQTIGELPVRLKYLACSLNQLDTLPVLPDSLVTLECHYNRLTELPNLPTTLEELGCSDNLLATLPSLPDSLNYLQCNNNNLSVLPALPKALRRLICSWNKLSTLPPLPNKLWLLSCEQNKITELPTLPAALGSFYCFENPLRALPPSLPPNLVHMMCYRTEISVMPPLPSTLKVLICQSCYLKSLPPLPDGLQVLNADSNCFEVFPVNEHPDVLTGFVVSPNRENCQILGMAETSSLSSASLYPNPATSSVTIRAIGAETFHLRNSLGESVLTTTILDIQEIQIESLPKGCYFYHLGDKHGTLVVR